MLETIVYNNSRIVNTLSGVRLTGELHLNLYVETISLDFIRESVNNNTICMSTLTIPLKNGECVILHVESFDLQWQEYYEETETAHGTLVAIVSIQMDTASYDEANVATNYKFNELTMKLDSVCLQMGEEHTECDSFIEIQVCDIFIEWY